MNEAPSHPGLAQGPIYLDYNAPTPVDPRVVDARVPYLTTLSGNPSSSHAYAKTARAAVETASEQVAELLSCDPSEILFTGSGSESDTLALRGVALASRVRRGAHIITQQTEHSAVKETCRMLERLYGFRVTELPVDHKGRVRPADLEAALTEQTVLVTIMLANNETGMLQPVAELARIAHRHQAPFHTDAAQAVGKIPISVGELGVELLTVVGHKLYAPKGVGALYVRRGTPLEPLIPDGARQESRHGECGPAGGSWQHLCP
jgi:cysteine desulfurase